MESCIILAAYLKRDVIRETFENMRPFLNINEKDGVYYYRIIIILKMLLIAFMMRKAVSNRIAQVMFAVSNAIIARKYSEIALLPAIGQCLLIFAPNKRFALFMSVSWMCILAMNIKSYEFVLDLCAVVSLLGYTGKAYKYEFQKLCTVIYMMLSLGWYVSRLDVYSLDRFFSVIGLLFLAYIPLRPNWPNKHRNRLNYLYALMFLWVVFKFQLFRQSGDQLKTVNTTRICRKWETCALTDNLTYAVGDQIMSAEALYEFNDIEIPNITKSTNLENSLGENVTLNEIKDIYITGDSSVETCIEDSSSLQKNAHSVVMVSKFLDEEAEINNEDYGNQNKQSDEDKQMTYVGESDSIKNTLQTEELANFEHSLETSTESVEDSLADNSKYEDQLGEYLVTDKENFFEVGTDDLEKEAVLSENVIELEQNSETSEKDTAMKECLEDVANNKEKISMESVEDSLADNSRYEDQIEEYHVTDKEKFVETRTNDLEKEEVLNENVVELERNSIKYEKDTTMKELLEDVTNNNEKIAQDEELTDVISDSAEQNSLTDSDGKCTKKREVSTDMSDANSMFQSVVLVKETKPEQMTEEIFESLTIADKLNSAEIDEKVTRDEMIKEDFTNNDLVKNNEKKLIKPIMDSETKLKVANTKDGVFTVDENSEDKLHEVSELSEGEILELRKVMIERNEVEEEKAFVITETDKFQTGFAVKDDSGFEVKDVLEKKPIEFLKESEKTVLREVPEKSVENQQSKEDDSSINQKHTSNTVVMPKDNVGSNVDAIVHVGTAQKKNTKQVKRNTYLVYDELPENKGMNLVAKNREGVEKVNILASSDPQQFKSSDSVQKMLSTVKDIPSDISVTHVSGIKEENKVNADLVSTVEEIVRLDEFKNPRVSKIRVTEKRMKNVEDALQTEEVKPIEAKVKSNIKNEIGIASNTEQGKSKPAKIVEERKNPVQRDATNLQGKSTDIFGYKSIREETKYPDESTFDDFESERIVEWEANFKSYLMQEEFVSEDNVPLKSSTKQQAVDDQPVIQNLFESFEDDTNNERLNRLDMVEYLRENDPYDIRLMDDYPYLVNEKNSYEGEDMDDDISDQDFEVTESDDSTTNEDNRNDRMHVVFRKRNGEYYIM